MNHQSLKWLKQKEKWSDSKRCIRCGLGYKEIENLGRWECSFHSGEKIDISKGTHKVLTSASWVNTPDYRWSCCPNVLWTKNHRYGCIKCDHTDFDMKFSGKLSQDIYVTWLPYINPKDEAIVKGSVEDYYNIKRSDQ